MILLIDADSLIFASCYRPKEDEEVFYDNLEDIVFKFDESFQKIVNDLSDVYDVSKVMTFNDSKGNFRKLITPKYKANRKDQVKPPLLGEIHNYVKKTYNGISGCGVETDDVVAKYWKEYSDKFGRDNVMIVSIDKDYLQFPALVYRYNRKEVVDLSQFDALKNFYYQMIIGDTADNVNYFKGKGLKFADKWFADCDTPYSFRRKMYELFKEQYKGKARQRYTECYNLLKLRAE
jgi:5'-3' exonuclease